MYLNCEAGKKLPFKSGFQEFIITEPGQVTEAFDVAETMSDIHTIVVDSLTYLMDMSENYHVTNAADTMKGWANFAQYFKNLMAQQVARSTKNVVFTAHTLDSVNEAEMVMETKVPVKGSIKNNGIESYFSCVIAAKKMPIEKLKDYESDLLTRTEEEEMLGLKYVFQTRLTKATVNERLRGAMGLFSVQETFIDNNLQLVFDRLHEYYD